MGKKIIIIVAALLCALLFAACGCEHVWEEATCLVPATCKECGKTEGELGEHIWQDATCDQPKKCTVCGTFSGAANGHQLDESTCTIYCTICGYIDPASAEHEWWGPTCVAPKFCFKCAAVDEAVGPLGHDWGDASCEELKQCKICNEFDTTRGGHTWTDNGCIKQCEDCNLVDFSTKPHTLSAGNGASSGTCAVCNKKIEYFESDGILYAVTEYADSGNLSETVTYVQRRNDVKADAKAVAVVWFEDNKLVGYTTDYFAVEGRAVYFMSMENFTIM